MRIEILDEAQDDLVQGFHFYEGREAGLGVYFLDCLFSDIDSLLVYAGIDWSQSATSSVYRWLRWRGDA